MRGTRQERSPGVWRLRVYLGRNGRGSPVYASRTYRGGPRGAEDALRRFVGEVERGRSPERNATLAALLDRWLDHIAPDRSGYTMREHRRSCSANIVPELGAVRLDRLTPELLDRTYATWLRRGLSAASVRRQHAIISAALEQAVKWGWIDRNPAARATPPSQRRPQPRAISAAELQAIVAEAEADHPTWGAAFALAAVTGARRGELCALRWSDVDLEGGVLDIGRALTVIDRQAVEGDTKTHQARRLALDPVAVAVLRQHRAWQEQLAEQAETRLVRDPWVLSLRADGGAPCLPDSLTHAFTRVCETLDLPAGHQAAYRAWLDTNPPKGARRPTDAQPYHLHELRHWAATTAIAAGVDVRTVAGRLGHADPSVTLRVYAHAVEARDQAAAAELGRALDVGRAAPESRSTDVRNAKGPPAEAGGPQSACLT